MAAIRSKNTAPEMKIRRLVHSMGYRYRLHRSDLPGKPDLVFSARNKVIFVNGCFWHQHDCKGSHLPKSNQAYWVPKLERNRARDAEHLKALRKIGWKALVVWECELSQDEVGIMRRLTKFLGNPSSL